MSRMSHDEEKQTIDVYQGVYVHQDNGILSKLRRWEATLDRRLGVESEAIDRKLPDQRQPPTWRGELSMCLLWASGTMNLSCVATGFLGWEFGLSLKQSLLISIFASLLGASVSAFTATLGAATGLRQISIGRYSMGWYPNKIIAGLNIIQQMGWSAVGCITGGVALVAASDGTIPTEVGMVIIGLCSLLISFLGLKVILAYERYAWFIYLVIFLIIMCETGKYTDNKTPAKGSSLSISGAALSLIAVVYGSSASWCTVAGDYYVLYPVNTSRLKIFLLTATGIGIPTGLGMSTGCVVAYALNNRPDWAETYNNKGIGFLLQQALYPYGFAKFLLIMLVLSGINCNVINTYSAAISCQQIARPCARIPRFIWTPICFCIIIALSLAGRNELLTYLENFLSLLGYWATSYFVIVFSEHFIFRKGKMENYNLQGWNEPVKLPIGLAALTAFLLGVVMWCMGMVQTWFAGPIGKMIGESGGDVANELTFIVTVLAYIPLRYVELKTFGR
ncbi:hypothetical protein K470DRAFT_289367 [Piedraia hortae CBS 480.64]|uniref:Nucleoside transporter n=1 Tax=Piedraia hortae CBS 480.64 TaxID=1314780 RepID=A0A6A7BVR2_9PEZI|nr:hypothetical protein K470DRAFT_289367 [Piedraia hortae CBS 480.64]